MAALVGTVGCGDDDVVPGDSGPGGTDAGPGGTDAGPGMMDGMVPMVDAGPGMTDGGGGGGACTNATDLPAIMGRYADGGAVDPDGGMGNDPRTIAGGCGLGCLTSADVTMCVSACLRAATGNAISMACTDCFGASTECVAVNCTSPCTTAAGPTAPACVACQCGMNTAMVNCISQFSACSGVPSTTCAALDGGTPAADAG